MLLKKREKTLLLVGAVCCLVGFALFATPASGQQTLSFDDITLAKWAPVPDGYGDFYWENCNVFDVSQAEADYYDRGSGYEWGIVSPPYVAYSTSDYELTVSRDSTFVFLGAYFAAAWYEDLTVTAEGYLEQQKVYSFDFAVDPWDSLWVDFPLDPIDSIYLHASGGSSAGLGGAGQHFVMDQFTFVPEPTTLSLLALGGLALIRRRRVA